MRLLYSLLALCFSASLFAQSVDYPATQQPLVGKRTASWCSNCGTWGWTLFESLLAENTGQAEIVALHYSGNLKTDAATVIASNFDASGQPVFTLNETDVNALSGNVTAKKDELLTAILDLNTTPATGGTRIELARSGDELTVTTQSQFFSTTDGTFYEGVYVVEKQRIAQQASQGPDAQHKNLLRDPLTDGIWGTLLTENGTDGAANLITDANVHTFDLTDVDPGNLRIITVLWQLVDGRYIPANTNGIDVNAATTGTYNVPVALATLEARPSLTDGPTAISLIITLPTNGALELVDAQGRTHILLPMQRFTPGRRWVPLDLSAYPAGTYFVRFVSPDGVGTTTVVKR